MHICLSTLRSVPLERDGNNPQSLVFRRPLVGRLHDTAIVSVASVAYG